MTIAIAQGVGQEMTLVSNTPSSPTTGINTSVSGSSFVCAIRAYSPSVTAVTDTFSNTYSLITAALANGSNSLYVYLCTNGTGGTAHKPSITQSSGDIAGVSFFEVTGAATSSLLDGTPGSSLDAASPFDQTVTTSTGPDLIIAIAASNSTSNPVTCTPSNGFVLESSSSFLNGTNTDSILVIDVRQTAAGTYGPNFTTGTGTNAAIITFALKELISSSNTASIAWVV